MVPSKREDRRQLVGIGATVIALHVIGWGGVFALAGFGHPALLGLAGLAYSFGLRHAFDADHIAAIDNTTRRLTTGASRPLGVGLFFSLGHSSIVLLMTALVAVAAQLLSPAMPWLQGAGHLVGTMISGVFLYAIALLNLVVLVDMVRVLRRLRAGTVDAAEMEARLQTGGVVSRWCGGLFRLVTRPWHMYLVGALFGLGFDTATEIGLLATAGVAASQALPLTAVLCLPIVFAAGMSLMDSADGVLMCGAYGWALDNPLRRIHYNLTMTGLSVAVALVVGSIELLSVAAERLPLLQGRLAAAADRLDLSLAGYAVVAIFGLAWAGSVTAARLGWFAQPGTAGVAGTPRPATMVNSCE
jgi:nickel/cobalt transporter (NiCoT) family protein